MHGKIGEIFIVFWRNSKQILINLCNFVVVYTRVGPTGFLQSDDDAKLKIDEF